VAAAPTYHHEKTSRDPGVERLKLFSIVDLMNCCNYIITEASKIIRKKVSQKNSCSGRNTGQLGSIV
jgi:hypothetical protein